MVQYYRDLWPKRSDILAPLTELTKGGPTDKSSITWTPQCDETFQKMKALIAKAGDNPCLPRFY